MDILRSATAPYFLTLIVSVFSWLFLEIKKDLADVAIVSYEEIFYQGVDGIVEEVTIKNLSDKAVLKNAKIDLLCPEKACLRSSKNLGGIAINKTGAPWNIAVNPSASDSQVTFNLNLPPNASTTIMIALVSNDLKPIFGFSYIDAAAQNTPVIFSSEAKLYAFMAIWYQTIITSMFFLSVALLMIFMLVSVFRWLCNNKNKGEESSQFILPIALADGKAANFELLLNVRKGSEK